MVPLRHSHQAIIHTREDVLSAFRPFGPPTPAARMPRSTVTEVNESVRAALRPRVVVWALALLENDEKYGQASR